MPNSPNHPSLYDDDSDRAVLQRMSIRNYKSIGTCNIQFGDVTVLAGRNGAGKSNFLDALRFVTDGLQTSLDHAVQARGGIDEVRRRSTGHPRNVALVFEWVLPGFRLATYQFELASRTRGAFAVKEEKLLVHNSAGERLAYYCVEDGKVTNGSPHQLPPAASDRLYLVTASGLPEFRSPYESFLSMGFYNLNPEAMKELQSPDAGEILHRDGANIASVVARLGTDEPSIIKRVNEYLATIVPAIKGFERVALGPKETLQFRQDVKGSKHPWRFYAANMSDGTLRALGALTAAMQLVKRRRPVTVVGIEEPEAALHPAAAGALMGALREASRKTQVVLTTHSPDLLDQVKLTREKLLVVEARQGTTHITQPDSASTEAIRTHLYTAGELLRMDQLGLDEATVHEEAEMGCELRFNEENGGQDH